LKSYLLNGLLKIKSQEPRHHKRVNPTVSMICFLRAKGNVTRGKQLPGRHSLTASILSQAPESRLSQSSPQSTLDERVMKYEMLCFVFPPDQPSLRTHCSTRYHPCHSPPRSPGQSRPPRLHQRGRTWPLASRQRLSWRVWQRQEQQPSLRERAPGCPCRRHHR